MNLIRKAMWPTAIVGGLLLFFGAIGTSVPAAHAATGDVCALIYEEDGLDYLASGDTAVMNEGDTVEFTAYFEDIGLGVIFDPEDFRTDVNLDDEEGDSDITSVGTPGDTSKINATDHLNAEPAFSAGNIAGCGIDQEELADRILDALIDCVDAGNLCDPNDYAPFGTLAEIADIAAEAISADAATCEEAGDAVEDALINLEPGNASEAADVGNDIEQLCLANLNNDNLTWRSIDGYLTVDVTCERPGEFQLSFAPEAGEEPGSVHVICRGEVDSAEISVRPSTVEIIPAFNNVSHSLVTVELFDKLGDAATPGSDVLFQVDRCSVEVSGVDTEEEFLAARSVFNAYNPLVVGTGEAVENSDAAKAAVDAGSRQQDEVESFHATYGGDVHTVAAAIVGCNPVDAPGATPGPITVTAIVERHTEDDLVLSAEIKAVGPVVASGFTVVASPTTVICGEKATIEVTLLDAAGQPVSDHTVVEAVTNFGGILGGTGAVAGGQGLVSPVSSTVAETFGGKATFYLLTSDTHEGPYEVVVTTGGAAYVSHITGDFTGTLGGYLTSAPLSVQVTVECEQPAPPAPDVKPTVTAPDTGDGITPPSTGDAGLVESSNGSSSLLFVLAGAFALVVTAAVAAPKLFRR